MKKNNKFLIFITTIAVFFLGSYFVKDNLVHASQEETYTIATDVTFPPFVFTNNNNQLEGIDIDLMKAIAKEEGFKVKFKPIGFNAAIQAVSSGQVNGMIAGMTITNERKQKFDFSNPYYSSGIVMAVNHNSKIDRLSELKGKKVAVKTGTSGADYANSIKNKYGFQVVTFDDSDNVYNDVKTGNSAACFDDDAVLKYGIQNENGLKIVTKPTAIGNYGFAVKKGTNQELMAKFNAGLVKLKKNGQYQKIIDKYTKESTAHKQQSARTFWGLIKQNRSALCQGLIETLKLTIVAIVFATIFGIIIGLLGVLPVKFLNWLSTGIIYIFRGLPLLVLALFIYNGIPSLTGTKIPAFIAGIITLTLNEGAYIAAFVKGGD